MTGIDTITKEKKDARLKTTTEQPKKLVLHNDDYNSFDHVINSLVTVCGHQSEQATQCAYIVHYKGVCDVKLGDEQTLSAMKDKLVFRGLAVTIEDN
jgi:ATP-dependent Clp protease adaptor protein ClpS